MVTAYEQQVPTAVAILERDFDDATAVLALPLPYRKRLRTTNGQERLNEEVRRRERVIRILPTRASVIRLLGTLLMEQEEQWSTGRRYVDMQAYWHWRQSDVSSSQQTASLTDTAQEAKGAKDAPEEA